MVYKGSCHCGSVAFEAEGEIDSALACNCSICQRKGSLLWFISRDKLKLRSAEKDLGSYTFNRHLIKHRFCRNCGIHPYGEAKGPDGAPMAAVNIRCLEGIDLAAVSVRHYDGRSL